MNGKSWHWHCSVDTGSEALERLGRAIVECEVAITSVWHLGREHGTRSGVTAFVVALIPEGEQERFRTILKPQHMGASPWLCPEYYAPPEEGHPGLEKVEK